MERMWTPGEPAPHYARFAVNPAQAMRGFSTQLKLRGMPPRFELNMAGDWAFEHPQHVATDACAVCRQSRREVERARR